MTERPRVRVGEPDDGASSKHNRCRHRSRCWSVTAGRVRHPRHEGTFFTSSALWHHIRAVLLVAAVAASLLTALAGLAWWRFGSVAVGLAYLRGERLVIEPRVVELGEGRPDERRDVVIRIINLTDRPVRLLGSSATCQCILCSAKWGTWPRLRGTLPLF